MSSNGSQNDCHKSKSPNEVGRGDQSPNQGQDLAKSPSLVDLIGQANVHRLDSVDPRSPKVSPVKLERPPSLYDLASQAGTKEDPTEKVIRVKARRLILASFLMSTCNTMQSIMYVPAALKVAGSPKSAGLLLATLHSTCAMLDIFLAPSFGSLTDFVGRKWPLLFLSATLFLNRFLMLLRQDKFTLTVSRILGSLSASLFSNTLTASILDLTQGRQEQASVYRALDSSAKGWGVVVGPWLGGLAAKKNLGPGLLSSTQFPFLLSGTFSALAFAWLCSSAEETLPVADRKPFKVKTKSLLGVLDLLGHGSQMNRMLIMSCLGDMGQRTAPIFALATRTMFGWDTETSARWILCYGLGMAIGPGFISKHTIRMFGLRGAHQFDSIGVTIASAMLALSRTGRLFWSSLLVYLFSLSFRPNALNIQMVIAQATIPNVGKGELTGRLSSLASISNMLSPQLYAWVFALFTSKQAPFYYPGVPFLMAASGYTAYFILYQGISQELVPWGKGKK